MPVGETQIFTKYFYHVWKKFPNIFGKFKQNKNQIRRAMVKLMSIDSNSRKNCEKREKSFRK